MAIQVIRRPDGTLGLDLSSNPTAFRRGGSTLLDFSGSQAQDPELNLRSLGDPSQEQIANALSRQFFSENRGAIEDVLGFQAIRDLRDRDEGITEADLVNDLFQQDPNFLQRTGAQIPTSIDPGNLPSLFQADFSGKMSTAEKLIMAAALATATAGASGAFAAGGASAGGAGAAGAGAAGAGTAGAGGLAAGGLTLPSIAQGSSALALESLTGVAAGGGLSALGSGAALGGAGALGTGLSGSGGLSAFDTSAIPAARSTANVIPGTAEAISGGSNMASLFGMSPSTLSNVATLAGPLLGGLFGDDKSTISSTQRTQLPPEISRGLNFLVNQSMGLANQQGKLTPDLSDPTMRGLGLLQQGFNPLAVDELTRLAQGQGTARIEDSITQAASRAVQDRFSQAGRSGSPAEGLTLGSTVARELAPFAFGAQRNALSTLLGLDQQRAQNFLTAGEVLEQNQEAQNLDPFRRLSLVTGPIQAAIGGAPTTTTSTQPVRRNRAVSGLGGALAGRRLAGELGGNEALGALGGGLIGGFL